MKAVMLSIRPEWCEKIAQGIKTIELRKTRPKLQAPFKCYIYCTKGFPMLWKDGEKVFIVDSNYEWLYFTPDALNGKVIGDFVCDAVLSHCEMGNVDLIEQMSCVRREKILEYSGGKEVFGWHISDLEIYDTPKELSEFVKDCPTLEPCEYCDMYFELEDRCCNAIRRPPQSWCYVEDLRYVEDLL